MPDANIIMIAMYVNTNQYLEYFKIKEEINCNILDLLERENIELVYPTQRIYSEKR